MSTTRSVAAHRLGVAFAIPCALWATGAPVAEAQEFFYDDVEIVFVAPGDPATKAAWGTQSRVNLSIAGSAFETSSSDDVISKSSSQAKWYVDGGGTATAALTLPTGVRVEAVEMAGCDVSSTNSLHWLVIRGTDTGEQFAVSESYGTDIPGTPGCGFYYNELQTPFTVNNLANSYFVQTFIADTNSITTFRVYYRLQVSPPPGSATFSDVPTGHPFFRHVEALADSGITSGCGGNRFCPGAPLTRGQMAVFLAKALGLHWPN